MSTITAEEIKRRGVSALAPMLDEEGEAVITVRGKRRYVVMTIQAYNQLRDAELAQAVHETKADFAAGRIADDSIEGHMRRIRNEV